MFEFQTKTNLAGANDSRTVTKAGALEQNSRNDELKNAVEAAAFVLTSYGTQVDTNVVQLAQAMFINGVSAQSFQDSGVANAHVLTPVTGASGLRTVQVADGYTPLNGAVFMFRAGATNTGPVTVNVGQTTGTLLGLKAIVDVGGAALTGGEIDSGSFVQIRYDLSLDYWELLNINSDLFARLNVAQNWTRQQFFNAQTLSISGGNIAWDLDTEQVAAVTLDQTATLSTPTNMQDGGQYRLLVIQDGTGGWALNFAGGTYIAPATGGDLPEIVTGAGETTLLNFDSDGTLMRVA